MGADDSHCAIARQVCSCQWQRAVEVLEKHNSLARRLQRQVAFCGCIDGFSAQPRV